MNARIARRVVAGLVVLAVVVLLAVYGTHAGTILGRLGLQIF